jgi:hypothetical protein
MAWHGAEIVICFFLERSWRSVTKSIQTACVCYLAFASSLAASTTNTKVLPIRTCNGFASPDVDLMSALDEFWE